MKTTKGVQGKFEANMEINKRNNKQKKLRQDMPDSVNSNGTIVSNQKEIANNLNGYSVNVGPSLARKISEQSTNYKAYLTNSYNNSIFLIQYYTMI